MELLYALLQPIKIKVENNTACTSALYLALSQSLKVLLWWCSETFSSEKKKIIFTIAPMCNCSVSTNCHSLYFLLLSPDLHQMYK